MKVIFECEECGRDLLFYHPADLHRPWLDSRTECDLRTVITQLTCPNCAKLTYGPLTEEMMAEALLASDEYADTVGLLRDEDLYTACARFILRLLIDGGLANDKPTVTHGCTAEDWRDWLLGLARQK